MASETLDVADRRLPLVYLENHRARRMIVRLDHGKSRVVVVIPRRASRAEARRFLLANLDWIRERVDLLPPRVRFVDGAEIPYFGVPHRLRHRPNAAWGVWREGRNICVGGPREDLGRHVLEWLRWEARRDLSRRAAAKAERLGKSLRRIVLRDTKTRWASCSPTGELSFSWRLVFAPPSVIDYIVAHEVAHLREFDHGSRFWRLTESLSRHVASARAWLDSDGATLHRYG